MFDFPGNLEQDDEDGGVRFGNDEEFVPRKGKGKNVGREENVEKKVLRKRVDRGLSEREEDGAEEEEVEVEQLSRQRRKKVCWNGVLSQRMQLNITYRTGTGFLARNLQVKRGSLMLDSIL